MSNIFTGIVATTELELINTMLSAIGESPLATGTDLSSVTATDVVMAINLARNTIREVNSMGWKYNLEFGFQLVPVGTIPWTGTDGSTATLNLFEPPANLVRYYISACEKQSGSRVVDLTLRPAQLSPPVDSLIDSNNPLLTAHISPGGYTWTRVPYLTSWAGSGTTPSLSSTGLQVLSSINDLLFRSSFALPSTTASIQANVKFPNVSASDLALGLRMKATSPARYEFSWGGSGGLITYFGDTDADTQSWSAPIPVYPVANAVNTMLFTAKGSLLQGWVNGVLVVSTTDTRLQAPGFVGLTAYGGGTGTYVATNLTVSVPGYLFYDRAKNRLGLDSTLYPFLYIDPTWSVDFVNLPEDARRYIAVRASRQLAQQVVSSTELAQFSAQDELFALRDLKRSEGQDDDLNMFNNIESFEMLGNRSPMSQGPIDERSSPSKV